MSALSIRRSIVVLVAIASLFGGAAVIRAAAGWAADATASSKAPPDAGQLVGQLEAEQAYAAALADQLHQVTGKADELRTALEAAQAKAENDAASADDLSAQLAAAQARLKTLEAQLAAAARARTTTTVTTVTAPPPATSGGGEPEDDGEHDD